MTKHHLLGVIFVLEVLSVPAVAQKKGSHVESGKAVFGRCSGCHDADTTDRKGGPGLKGLFKRAKLESTGKPVTAANVLKIINEGHLAMPAYKTTLSSAEKADLLAYLKTL